MKISITIFIFLSFISYVINEHPFNDCGDGTTIPTSAADCKDELLSDTQKKKGYVKCCLLEEKKNEYNGKSCIRITEKQGKKLGTIIKELEKSAFYLYSHDISIDCKSSYLKAGLVLLISFIIF